MEIALFMWDRASIAKDATTSVVCPKYDVGRLPVDLDDSRESS